MRKLTLTLLVSTLVLLSSFTVKAQRLPVGSPLNHFARWEGGALELKRRQLLGQLPSNNPQLPEAIRQWYSLPTLKYLKGADIDGIWLSWSIGLSPHEEERHDPAATAYTAECHRAGITVLAMVSAGHRFFGAQEAAHVAGLLRDAHGKPTLCDQLSGFSTHPLQCYQADLDDPSWKTQVATRSSAAIEAGADGVILDGLSSPHYDSHLVAYFANEIQGMLTSLVPSSSRSSASIKKRSTPLMIPLLPWSILGQHLETPFLAMEDGVWPGVRSSAPSLVNGEITVAGASQSPWIDSNLWLLHCVCAFSEGKPLFVTYPGGAGTTHLASVTSTGALRLATAEAAALGASSVPVLDDRLRQGLFDRNPAILEEWNEMARYRRFFKNHPEVTEMKLVQNVAIIVQSCDNSAEALNLMSRRRLLYDVIPANEFAQTSLEPYTLLIVEQPGPWPNDFFDKMRRFAEGGLLVTVATSPPSSDQLRSFQKVEETPERIAYSNGEGKWVAYRDAFPDPDTFATELNMLLDPNLQPVRMWNAAAVLAQLAQSLDSKQRALHLINYGIDPVEDLQVQVKGSFRKGEVLAPDLPTPVPLALSRKEGATEFTIPSLGIYGLVLLE